MRLVAAIRSSRTSGCATPPRRGQALAELLAAMDRYRAYVVPGARSTPSRRLDVPPSAPELLAASEHRRPRRSSLPWSRTRLGQALVDSGPQPTSSWSASSRPADP